MVVQFQRIYQIIFLYDGIIITSYSLDNYFYIIGNDYLRLWIDNDLIIIIDYWEERYLLYPIETIF